MQPCSPFIDKEVEMFKTYKNMFMKKFSTMLANGLPGKNLLATLTMILCLFAPAAFAQTGAAVKADFTFRVDNDTRTVKFEARASANVLAYAWDFGDGNDGKGKDAKHTYSADGSYKVCLTVYAFDSILNTRISTTVCKKVDVRLCQLKADFDLYISGSSVKVEAKSNSNHAVYGYNFGDGTVTRGQALKHTYAADGTYEICLFVKDTATGCTAKVCKRAVIKTCDLEVAFEFAQDGNEFKFRAKANDSNAKFVWNFGDGSSAMGSTTKHEYDQSGNYQVCVTAYLVSTSTQKRCTATVCKKVRVDCMPDTCNLKADFKYEVNGKKVVVKARSNQDNIIYYWSFGDGDAETGVTARHKYNKYGSFELCLIAFNPKTKCKVTICKRIILEKPCKLRANFRYSVDGNVVKFKAKSNASASVYAWDFGDGTKERGNPIRHKYTKPGIYVVTLYVKDPRSGCTLTVSKRILIVKPSLVLPPIVDGRDADAKIDADVEIRTELGWKASVSPNPANSSVTIEVDNQTVQKIQIIAFNGNVLIEEEVSLDSQTQVEIDINTLPTGYYFARIIANDGSVKSVKFIKL
ncbi:MAG: PKD repeat protein [Bacteroidia bacterium]|jgi:PKD repeat protein